MTLLGIFIGVIAYGFIVVLLLGIARDAKRGDERGVSGDPIGQASVGEFGYPMPSTTQPAAVGPVSGYANPDSAYANKRFERKTWNPREHGDALREHVRGRFEYTPDGESFGMGV